MDNQAKAMADTSRPVTIRPARHTDLEAIETLIRPWIAEGKLLPRTMDELEELVDSGFVAEGDGRVVGFVVLEVYSQKLAEIRSLVVAPEVRGQGVGRALVAACVEQARQRSILEVMAVSSAESFFRACGFGFTLPDERKAYFLRTRDGDS